MLHSSLENYCVIQACVIQSTFTAFQRAVTNRAAKKKTKKTQKPSLHCVLLRPSLRMHTENQCLPVPPGTWDTKSQPEEALALSMGLCCSGRADERGANRRQRAPGWFSGHTPLDLPCTGVFERKAVVDFMPGSFTVTPAGAE